MRHVIKSTYTVCLLFILSAFLFVSCLWASGIPRLNEGKKWRIGYYEGGPYSDYTDTMRTFVRELIELEWIKEANAPELFEEISKPYWDWLSRCNSPFLSFKAEDGYSANWDNSQRAGIRKLLMEKLKAGALDLVIAMGTWAGQDLANNEHSVPTMVLSTSNPIQAGIIKSADNSGFHHVTARVDPNRYLRQIRMFHRIVRFQTLGFVYENTPEGRIYSAVSEVNRIAKERGFKVVTCEVIDTTADTLKSDQSCMVCYRQLVQKADAVYVTALTCADRMVTELAEVFREAGVPSFSMVGSKYVQKGIMLSISSDSGYTNLGRYNAKKFTEILNGTQAGTMKQVFEDPLEIAVNMETVRQIEFNMPESILSIAAEVYGK